MCSRAYGVAPYVWKLCPCPHGGTRICTGELSIKPTFKEYKPQFLWKA
ncbi:hypothetical protein [Pleurochrysis sp. endemic virus unk]|nr:hypothetical protein [Pleurochrysis sp. endemic virus unk]